ncbi:MAG TPA: hypothetical protein VLF68_01685 [Candidatus Saccharimonadales bacterium]|nr:hypothetical protein [Candidatus Saccharimonadales bacterium]
MKRLLFFLPIFLLMPILKPALLFADAPPGIAVSVPVIDKNAKDGDIISSTSKGYTLSKSPYDPSEYGVISDTPAVGLEPQTPAPGTHLIISVGKAFVNVTTTAGPIHKNDFITSSAIAGKGERAIENGFVLGTALEDYTDKDPKKVGKILAVVSPHFNGTFSSAHVNLFTNLKNASSGTYLDPVSSIRYILAGVLAVVSFILGFLYFTRVAIKGVESIGRNPLARRTIQLSIILNVLLSIAIVGIGVAIAYLILVV